MKSDEDGGFNGMPRGTVHECTRRLSEFSVLGVSKPLTHKSDKP